MIPICPIENKISLEFIKGGLFNMKSGVFSPKAKYPLKATDVYKNNGK